MKLTDQEIQALSETPEAARMDNARKALLFGDLDGKSRGNIRHNNCKINVVRNLRDEIQTARGRGASLANILDIILRETGIPVTKTTLCKYAHLYDV